MSHFLSPKSLDALRWASDRYEGRVHAEAIAEIEELCAKHGIVRKQWLATLEKLARRGYLDYGVSVAWPWPTVKGWAALVVADLLAVGAAPAASDGQLGKVAGFIADRCGCTLGEAIAELRRAGIAPVGDLVAEISAAGPPTPAPSADALVRGVRELRAELLDGDPLVLERGGVVAVGEAARSIRAALRAAASGLPDVAADDLDRVSFDSPPSA